jgi:hypothetical protein
MQEVLNSLLTAHQQTKDVAIAALQSDQPLEQHVIDTIKSIYALIQAVKAATGL